MHQIKIEAQRMASTIAGRMQLQLLCCKGCDLWFKNHSLFCESCLENIEQLPSSFGCICIGKHELKYTSAFEWQPGTRDDLSNLVLCLKGLKHQPTFEYWAHRILKVRLEQADPIPRKALIIPSPAAKPHNHDHAFRLALAISKITGWPLQPTFLRRPANYIKQRGGSRTMREALRMENPENFTSSLPVVFVDDVVTTGSTAAAAYQALNRPKDFEIWSLTYRTPIAAESHK